VCILLEQNQYSTPLYACHFISLVANMRGRTFSHEIVEAGQGLSIEDQPGMEFFGLVF
jgi:hypothetical protein